ncbi:MAG: D-glycero-beta-D-manno-heptose 1-phosphate adenylyltransferase [Candidatus Muiribacteriota bacterium]
MKYKNAKNFADKIKEEGKKIVFTNGCFDIIHAGHISYLNKAAGLGDFLIVGLNSDSSIKRLKGEGRPVNNENARKTVMEALKMVDAVFVFEEDTPIKLIKAVKPDYLVKGGDYKKEEVVGFDFLKKYNGQVVIIDYVPGYSTTEIINSCQNKQGE